MSTSMQKMRLQLKVLHLDDDVFETERVRKALEKHSIDCDFFVTSASNADEYLQLLNTRPLPDLVILDIHVGDLKTSGIELANQTRTIAENTVVLICSTADDVATIASCLGAGADDFISKNSDKGELSLRVFNSYRLAKLKGGTETPTSPAKAKVKPIGATMERISRRIPLVIQSAISAVFIRGETGTGKEVVADLVGTNLAPGKPFVKVNCGAISPSLLESELFGYVKGAFTGATSDKRGLLESASGGWIFLDEVATLTLPAQVALLRVLENQELMKVGATKPTAIKIRLLSATNEPMEKLVKKGKFRADLWQRLRETEIVLPPLRQRVSEIPALIEHFCNTMAGGPYAASGPAIEVLSNISWKDGNIRELRNCLRAMTEMHVNKLLTPLAIPERIWLELGEKPPVTEALQKVKAKNKKDSPPEAQITLPWHPHGDPTEHANFEQLTQLLLLKVVESLALAQGRLTLESLAHHLGFTRVMTTQKLKELVQAGLTTTDRLAQLVSQKSLEP